MNFPLAYGADARAFTRARTPARVSADVPAYLQRIATHLRGTVLDFARRWTVSPENPLTARVIVNRMVAGNCSAWALSIRRATLEMMGNRPSNPDLLDWPRPSNSARGGWNVKHHVSTDGHNPPRIGSRQKSLSRALEGRSAEKSPRFRAGPRFRMDGEMLRDSAFGSVGAWLVDQIGGPPVKPYQPTGIWEAVSRAFATRPADVDSGSWAGDVSAVALHVSGKRQAPPPGHVWRSMPRCGDMACHAARSQPDTPLQGAGALETNTQWVEAGPHALAARAMDAAKDDHARLEFIAPRGALPAFDE